MRSLTGSLLLSLSIILLTAGCERADPVGPDQLEPTFSSIQSNIFAESCALSGCHLGSSAPFGLDLSAGEAYDNLVDVRSAEVPDLFRIEPDNPDDSYLVIKIEGGSRIAPGTQRMPRGRPPLSSEEISIIREWVADGAPNN